MSDDENKVHYRISKSTAALMVAVAVCFDLPSIIDLFIVIPAFSAMSAILGVCVFAVWFKFKGVGLINPKKIAAWATGGIVESIPYINILPGITIGVVATIIITHIEDKTGLHIPVPGETKKPLHAGKPAENVVQFRKEARARNERLDGIKTRREDADAPPRRTTGDALPFRQPLRSPAAPANDNERATGVQVAA